VLKAVAVSWQVLRRPRASRASSSSPFLRASSARSYQVPAWAWACSAWFWMRFWLAMAVATAWRSFTRSACMSATD